jgi:hypothetical protein
MTVFNVDAVTVAINHPDPEERIARCRALSDLIEHFHVRPTYDVDSFTGILDVMPAPKVMTALA